MRAVITYLRRLIGATNVVILRKATRMAKGLPTASRHASRAHSAARREALVVVSKVAPCLGRVPYLVTSARRAPPGHFYSGRGAARALVTLPRDVAYDNAKSPRVNSHQCRKCSEARSRS